MINFYSTFYDTCYHITLKANVIWYNGKQYNVIWYTIWMYRIMLSMLYEVQLCVVRSNNSLFRIDRSSWHVAHFRFHSTLRLARGGRLPCTFHQPGGSTILSMEEQSGLFAPFSYVCWMCVCQCVGESEWEREREREGASEWERERESERDWEWEWKWESEREWEWKSERVREWEITRESKSVCACVCVCVWERERESMFILYLVLLLASLEIGLFWFDNFFTFC